MASEWRKVKIGDLGQVVTGRTPPGTKDIYFGGEVPFLTPTDMNGKRVCSTTLRTLSKEGVMQLRNVIVPNGVSVSCIGWQMGKAIRLRGQAATNQQINTIVPNKMVDEGFLYYVLSSKRKELFALGAGGSRTPILNKSAFQAFVIDLPALGTQTAIARLLEVFDLQIESLQDANSTLEAVARAIFKSWFVDFDPVRAKAEGREPEGMDAATAALFPGALQASELGMIPEEWRCESIGNLTDIVGGSTPSTAKSVYWEDGEHFWATPKDLSNNKSPVLLSTERKVTTQGLEVISSGLLPPGTILLSSRAPIGYLALAKVPVAINQGFIAMKPFDGVPNTFLLLWTEFAMDQIKSLANGSTFQEISKRNFRTITLIRPSASVLLAFDGLAKPFYDRITANVEQARTLAELRDTLLPRLISGKLRVPEAEKLVEAVL